MKSYLVSFVIHVLMILPYNAISQTEYDKRVIGTWKGTISGSGVASKSIIIVVTKSNYVSNDLVHEGKCEGYSLVNNGNKTFFTGRISVEADMPILEVNEPKTSGMNGSFFLEFGCFINDELDSELCCGTWTSYDKTLKRHINVRKIK